jgi:hypothetical protein
MVIGDTVVQAVATPDHPMRPVDAGPLDGEPVRVTWPPHGHLYSD